MTATQRAVPSVGPLEPLPHQTKAIHAAASHLAFHSRAQIVVACGGGKTLIGAELARELAANLVLVVVPTLDLVAQTAADYARQEVGDLVAVCSDAEVLADAAGLDDMASAVTRLHGRVTTRATELAAWLRSATATVTVLVTYASLPVIAAAHRDHDAPGWDLVVVDEAHRSAGRTDRAWNLVHDNAAIPARWRLYMTATPRIMNSERYESVSMDCEAVFGREVYRLGFAEAIELGLICDYRVVVSVVTDQEVAAFLAAKGRILDVQGRPVPARTVATQIALLKACEEFGLRRVISYHNRVLSAAVFATTLPMVGDLLADAGMDPLSVQADWVSGEQHPDDRRAALRALATPGEQVRVVANARVLTEGVNVPALHGVLFADTRSDPTGVVQATSRALRRGDDPDKVATIIIPVLATAGENPISALEGSEFEQVWQTVRALRSHDDRLADWLDEHRVALTREDPHMPTRLLRLPHWLLVRGAPITPEFATAITVRAVETATPPWWETYALAAQFYEQHGHLRPGAEEPRLRTFLDNNRTAAKQGRLQPERRAALERIAMEFDLAAQKGRQRWNDLLYACNVYEALHGDLKVNQTFRLIDDRFPAPGYPLGSRINVARSYPDRIPQEVRAQLDALGMVWNVLDAKFAELLVHARHWTSQHPDTPPPSNITCCEYYELGQRLQTKITSAEKGRLPRQQWEALEKLGLLRRRTDHQRAAFLAACDRWLDAQRKAGVTTPRLDVPVTYIDATGYNLGDGIAYQRALRAGTVRDATGRPRQPDADMAAELDKRGMVWRAAPTRREVTNAELNTLRGLSGRKQTLAIIELIDQHVTQSSIADALGIQRPTLNARIQYARTHPAPARPAITDEQATRLRELPGREQTQAAMELIEQGVTQSSIAKIIGIHTSSLRDRITALRPADASAPQSQRPQRPQFQAAEITNSTSAVAPR